MTKLSANYVECEGVKNEILLWGFCQESLLAYCTNLDILTQKLKLT